MAEAAEGEFDLGSLDDAELVEQVHDDMYNGLKAEVERGDAYLPRARLEARQGAERRAG